MKIKKINDTDYQIMMISSLSNESKIIVTIKEFIKKFQNKLGLKGFYKIKVYHNFWGLLFQIIQIDDSYYKNSFDYRIIFNEEEKIYFQTTDYFVIEKCRYIYYFEDYYYALVDDSFDELFEKVEFGDFVLESDIDLKSSVLIFNK